jgi:hypothetical protein
MPLMSLMAESVAAFFWTALALAGSLEVTESIVEGLVFVEIDGVRLL